MHVDESEEFLSGRSDPILVVESKGHAVHAFVNQKLQGDPSLQILMHEFCSCMTPKIKIQ